MTRLLKIIGKHLNNDAVSLDFNVACVILECRRDFLIASIRVPALGGETTPMAR